MSSSYTPCTSPFNEYYPQKYLQVSCELLYFFVPFHTQGKVWKGINEQYNLHYLKNDADTRKAIQATQKNYHIVTSNLQG